MCLWEMVIPDLSSPTPPLLPLRLLLAQPQCNLQCKAKRVACYRIDGMQLCEQSEQGIHHKTARLFAFCAAQPLRPEPILLRLSALLFLPLLLHFSHLSVSSLHPLAVFFFLGHMDCLAVQAVGHLARQPFLNAQDSLKRPPPL